MITISCVEVNISVLRRSFIFIYFIFIHRFRVIPLFVFLCLEINQIVHTLHSCSFSARSVGTN